MIISFKMIHQVSWSKSNKQTRLSFDRDKPRNLEFELWFIDFGPLLWTGVINWTTHYHSDKHFFDNVLLEHGGPPHVLPLAAEHSKSLLLFELFYSRPPLCLNVMGGGWWPTGFYFETAKSPNSTFPSENRKEH